MTTKPLVSRSMFTGLIALLAIATVTTACSSSKKSAANGANTTTSTTSTAPTTSAGGGATTSGSSTSGGTLVHVKDFAFNPRPCHVAVGSEVTWQFDDSISHNVEASDNSFKSKISTTVPSSPSHSAKPAPTATSARSTRG